MARLPKDSTNYLLSEYLADLERAGVRDYYRGDRRQVGALAQTPDTNDNTTATRRIQITRESLPTSASHTPSGSVPIPTAPQVDHAVLSPEGQERKARLDLVRQEVATCARCAELVANRKQTVFGSGNPEATLLFLGEGPGAEEDLRGEPFVGRSGQLLTDMIEKGMKIPRASVYICNVVRCRPPQNRNPLPEEANACRPFLEATLRIIQPKFICCLGAIAATNLLQQNVALGKLRGVVHEYQGARVVCTYHPAYLLRNPSAKKQAWEDLQLLMREMGLR